MRIPARALPRLRLATLAVFATACVLFFGYLWVNSGGAIPGLTSGRYRVTARFGDIENLVYDSSVQMAGVEIGRVRETSSALDGTAVVLLEISEPAAAPLHEGVRVRIKPKTLVGETYVEVDDGTGAEIPSGATLARSAAVDQVRADDLLDTLDAPTRAALSALLQRLGASVDGRDVDLARVLTGLGDLGREGHDALDIIAAQSEDLRALVAETGILLQVLDEGDGQLARLATSSARLNRALAGRSEPLRASVRRLPGLLEQIRTASDSLGQLSGELAPIARDLRRAAPDLNAALVELGPAAEDLRAALPDLNAALKAAPPALEPLPPVARQLSRLSPPLEVALSDVNPVLAYLSPYGPDFAGTLSNFSSAVQRGDANGHYVRVLPVLSEQSLKNAPIPSEALTGQRRSNAYPRPRSQDDPMPNGGRREYPRVEEDD